MSDTLIIVLPPEHWREAKLLRLEALLAKPSAYASSYADELAFGDEVWINRATSACEQITSLAFYAEHEAKLVGMVGAGWSDRTKTRHVAEVFGVYVSTDMRGKGISARLIRSLLDALVLRSGIEKVKLSVTVGNLAAIHLYKGMGFEVVGRAIRELQINGIYYDLHYMEKSP